MFRDIVNPTLLGSTYEMAELRVWHRDLERVQLSRFLDKIEGSTAVEILDKSHDAARGGYLVVGGVESGTREDVI